MAPLVVHCSLPATQVLRVLFVGSEASAAAASRHTLALEAARVCPSGYRCVSVWLPCVCGERFIRFVTWDVRMGRVGGLRGGQFWADSGLGGVLQGGLACMLSRCDL